MIYVQCSKITMQVEDTNKSLNKGGALVRFRCSTCVGHNAIFWDHSGLDLEFQKFESPSSIEWKTRGVPLGGRNNHPEGSIHVEPFSIICLIYVPIKYTMGPVHLLRICWRGSTHESGRNLLSCCSALELKFEIWSWMDSVPIIKRSWPDSCRVFSGDLP